MAGAGACGQQMGRVLLAVGLGEGSVHGLYMSLLLAQESLHVLDLFSIRETTLERLKVGEVWSFPFPKLGTYIFWLVGSWHAPFIFQKINVLWPTQLSTQTCHQMACQFLPVYLLAFCNDIASLKFRSNHILHSQTSGLRKAVSPCRYYPCSGLAFVCVCVCHGDSTVPGNLHTHFL